MEGHATWGSNTIDIINDGSGKLPAPLFIDNPLYTSVAPLPSSTSFTMGTVNPTPSPTASVSAKATLPVSPSANATPSIEQSTMPNTTKAGITIGVIGLIALIATIFWLGLTYGRRPPNVKQLSKVKRKSRLWFSKAELAAGDTDKMRAWEEIQEIDGTSIRHEIGETGKREVVELEGSRLPVELEGSDWGSRKASMEK
jgi:hypothetical protein